MNVDDLIQLEAITRLKYRYLRCLDQKLWDDIVAVFAPDATAEYSGGAHAFAGRDAIVAFLRDSMGSTEMLTSHRCHHPEIDLGGDTATGTWAMDDVVIMADMGLTVRGAGFYEDRYVRRDGEWVIAHTGYRRSFEEIEKRAGGSGPKLTASWWATDGRSQLQA